MKSWHRLKQFSLMVFRASWDEDRIRELLKKYGEIEKIHELARNMHICSEKGFWLSPLTLLMLQLHVLKASTMPSWGKGEYKANIGSRY